ncbi:MAG: hypothetical protein R3324_14355, partial [Halobacteriales archaeon]|nr:hypothetical protein [Halobacteriales archaeon]
FDKPSCASDPDHPSCKDEEPAPAGDGTVDLTGDVTTDSPQPVVISKDSRNHLAGSGGGEDFSIVDALDLFAAAGSPSRTDLDGCVTDPSDLASTDPDAVQRLIDRLTDGSQSRTFRFTVNRKDPANMTGGINQTWVDDGRQYRTRITESSLRPGDAPVVTSPSDDVYVYEEGSIVSWDMSTDEALACPNGGSVTMTLNR